MKTRIVDDDLTSHVGRADPMTAGMRP